MYNVLFADDTLNLRLEIAEITGLGGLGVAKLPLEVLPAQAHLQLLLQVLQLRFRLRILFLVL